ncbi:MAG: class I SAM-dependent methyltransferase [Synechococcales cyanobacterium]
MSTPEAITQAVQAQYEAFPYPPVPIEHTPGMTPYCSYALGHYARTRTVGSPQGKRALVAGCGSGHEIHLVVASNPGVAEVVGVDLSHQSIALAEARLRHHHLHQCRAQVGNLLDAPTLPAGPFDWIVSFGVIHHTGDPVLALKNLEQKLAPGGTMALMLYNRDGRYPVYQIRRALELLGSSQMTSAQQIDLARTVLAGAQPGTITAAHQLGNAAYYAHDENVIDNFFHPQDQPFTIAEIDQLLTAAGLEFLDVVPDPHSWRLETILSPICADLYQRYQQLSRLEQLRLMELLHPSGRSCTVFWCCRAGEKTAPASAPIESSLWQLNPYFDHWGSLTWQGQPLALADPPPFAGDGHVDLHWDLCHGAGQVERLSLGQWALLASIADHPRKGSRLLAHAPDDWGERWQHWEQERLVLRVGDVASGGGLAS